MVEHLGLDIFNDKFLFILIYSSIQMFSRFIFPCSILSVYVVKMYQLYIDFQFGAKNYM